MITGPNTGKLGTRQRLLLIMFGLGGGGGGTRKTKTIVVAYLGSSHTNYTVFVKMFGKIPKKIIIKRIKLLDGNREYLLK
jgi:hypothetical protein